ncbi:MAG TPA: hypothetical protein VGB77_15090 [Abditibacteriaceae bacterium]|jgi:hypothetical protein
MPHDNRSLWEAAIGDGRPLLLLTGLSLALSGGFALFLATTGQFLPHDVAFLGMAASQLCELNGCRIVHFMMHDRAAFGGALLAIGGLYMWLAEFPLRAGQAWAWWLFALSGALGFSSFLAYLGYGYLDTWHGVATILLLPCYVIGLARVWRNLPNREGMGCLLRPSAPFDWKSHASWGRLLLLGTAVGMVAAGLTIMTVGMTSVFVPEDLAFMDVHVAELRAINPRLVPLIAHDRAGFGGGIATTGLTVFFIVWCAQPSRSLWQILALAGLTGFGAAIGVHFVIGYTNFIHLLPAFFGAIAFAMGMMLSVPGAHNEMKVAPP